MEFQQTGLPDKPVFHDAFNAGWAKYLDQSGGDVRAATAEYLRGPVAMARLICEHGGECRQMAAAACLAGPAVFSANPATWLNSKLLDFSREVTGMQTTCAEDFRGAIPRQSGDARLFFQASAILLMEQLAHPVAGRGYDAADAQKIYTEALDMYSAARGAQDTYKLDTRFEIAAMKVTTVLESRPHIWTVSAKAARTALPRATVQA